MQSTERKIPSHHGHTAVTVAGFLCDARLLFSDLFPGDGSSLPSPKPGKGPWRPEGGVALSCPWFILFLLSSSLREAIWWSVPSQGQGPEPRWPRGQSRGPDVPCGWPVL